MDDEGAMGIGAMIVFIAMVIVAAVAAAVLINTAGNLQRKSLETGKEAQQEVAANIFIRDIMAKTNASYTEATEVHYYISLAPGSESIDLNRTVIRWYHGDNLEDIQNASSADCPNPTSLDDGFCIIDVKDGGDGDRWVLSEGDRVRIKIVLADGEKLGTRESVDALFLPEVGSPVAGAFKTPATFGNEQYHSLL